MGSSLEGWKTSEIAMKSDPEGQGRGPDPGSDRLATAYLSPRSIPRCVHPTPLSTKIRSGRPRPASVPVTARLYVPDGGEHIPQMDYYRGTRTR